MLNNFKKNKKEKTIDLGIWESRFLGYPRITRSQLQWSTLPRRNGWNPPWRCTRCLGHLEHIQVVDSTWFGVVFPRMNRIGLGDLLVIHHWLAPCPQRMLGSCSRSRCHLGTWENRSRLPAPGSARGDNPKSRNVKPRDIGILDYFGRSYPF